MSDASTTPATHWTELEEALEREALKNLTPSAITLGRVARVERNLLLNALDRMPLARGEILAMLRAGQLDSLRK